jgi:hypothetical protein
MRKRGTRLAVSAFVATLAVAVGGGWYGGMSTGRWDAVNGHDALGGRARGAIDS